MQSRLWDLPAGRSARDAAIERVGSSMPAIAWAVEAERVLLTLARSQEFITSEAVWRGLEDEGVPRPRESRAMGPVMMRARRAGIIVRHATATAEASSRHAGLMTVFRSTVYRP